MSQDLATQNQSQQFLAGLKQHMPSAFMDAYDPNESLSDGIGQSYGIIRYAGKNWSLALRGQTYLFTRPDDGTPASYIDVVIVRQASHKSKSLYDGFDQDSAGKRPICSSLDAVTPDPDAQTPQSTACAICPRNQWKTDAKGVKHKDCSDYKRVAVLLLPNVTQRMLGQQLLEPVFLRVPAASLNDLANYGEQLRQMGLPYFAVVTRITFDPTKNHPQMQFRPLQGLTANEAPVIVPMREDALTKRIVGADQIRPPLQLTDRQVVQPLPVAAAGFAPPPPAPVAPVVVQLQPAPPPAAPPPAAAPVIHQQAAPEPGPEPTGFGTAAPPPAAPVTAPVTLTLQPVADVGKPEAADDDIDSRLANLLPQVA